MASHPWRSNAAVLAVTLLLIVGLDRLLLAVLGLPLWMADPELHYTHRPGVTRTWRTFDDKPIVINRHGHHDDDFPTARPPGEYRILNLGDSVTMGHGMTRDETFSNQLERLLEADATLTPTRFQVINAGVQGYSTFQEVEVLRRSLVFDPTLITVGFCLNDVTEPFVVDKRFGGTGLDYHRVVQTTHRLTSYLLNETGYGRLVQELRLRIGDVQAARIREGIDVRRMVTSRDDPQTQRKWTRTFADLERLYDLARRNDLPVVLLLFPFTFQFDDAEAQWPQRALIEHARRHDIAYIDFTEVFEARLHAGDGTVADYFLDDDHFTAEGHAVVARTLHAFLRETLRTTPAGSAAVLPHSPSVPFGGGAARRSPKKTAAASRLSRRPAAFR